MRPQEGAHRAISDQGSNGRGILLGGCGLLGLLLDRSPIHAVLGLEGLQRCTLAILVKEGDLHGPEPRITQHGDIVELEVLLRDLGHRLGLGLGLGLRLRLGLGLQRPIEHVLVVTRPGQLVSPNVS